jgi:hypothetical protein
MATKSIQIGEIAPHADSSNRKIRTGQHQYYFGERGGVVVLAKLPTASGGKWIERFIGAGVSVDVLRGMDSDATIELANSLIICEMNEQNA